MLNPSARRQAHLQVQSWRQYQNHLKEKAAKRQRLKLWLSYAVICCGVVVGLTALFYREESPATPIAEKHPVHAQELKVAVSPIEKKDVGQLIDGHSLLNLQQGSFKISANGQSLQVDTSLDETLQTMLLEKLDRVNSRYIGIVAMNPDTGRVLAMTGYDKTGSNTNPCIENSFPAASIFKIVTAAAAAQELGYSGDTELTFSGAKHTLYKSQLKQVTPRWATRITFGNSFAESVNPVFGRIGALQLGKQRLEQYGSAFGFNQSFGFELALLPSRLSIHDDPYHLAEIASGFNNDTTLSPIHAAIIVSAILNEGRLVEPTIIDQVIDSQGNLIYRNRIASLNQALDPSAAMVVRRLMETTVKSGTARKPFRGSARDKVLCRLSIGGKTGSIFNKTRECRFDWFVGYAVEKEGPEKMVLAAVVAHEEFIGRRAGEYARLAFKTYFNHYFAKDENKGPQNGKS
jgi:cell division protein FtsI/penicillin-binding protein 2